MTSNAPKSAAPQPVRFINWLFPRLFSLLAALLLAGLMPQAALAAPAVGTVIGNSTSITYTDASLVPRTVTSNTVNTTVQQVASLTLTASQAKIVAPGGTVYFPHTLTNTGNGPDTFNLTAIDANSGNITFTGLVMYVDANGDGVPDNVTAITTTGVTPVAAGATFKYVVAASVGAVVNGDADTITATAASVFTPAATASNTDTVNVSANAVVNVTKAISAPSGASPSGPYTITLTYNNTGNSTATDVALYDALPAGMTYVAGSGRWSVSGTTVLTDGAAVAEVAPALGNIVYDTTTAPDTVYARIASVAAGVTGNLTFQVNIASNVLAGALNNTAKWCYDNNGASAGGLTPAACDPLVAASVSTNGTSTNTVGFIVNQTASVTIRDTGVSDAPLAQSDTDLTLNDIALVSVATQGATVSFKSVIVNNGNFADTFSLATSASTFPPGTTFLIFQADGVTPLVGATPAVAALGGLYSVFVKATLPIGATNITNPGPYNVTLTATSVFNVAVSDTTTDRLTAIASSVVDLTNNFARLDSTPAGTAAAGNSATTGFGATGATVITTNIANAGTTTRFTLYVNNVVGPADSYNLTAAIAGSPAGWSVVFRDSTSTGIGTGVIITNTGTINSSANRVVYADVTLAASAPPGTTNIDFTITSPSTGATEVKRDAVTINTVRSITLSPASQTAQVLASATAVYTHIITNAGNVTEGGIALGQVALSLPATGATAGWTTIIYWDKNNDGVLDAGDPVVSDLFQLTGGSGGASTAAGLDPAESARLFVKVTAPSTAVGDVNTVTLTATVAGTINTVAYVGSPITVTDQTTIIGGTITAVKEQALDPLCNNTVSGVFAQTPVTAGAIPGACIRYRITATNVGVAAATTVVASDATPPNTKYNDGAGLAGGVVTGAALCTGVLGTAPAAHTTAGTLTGPACNTTGTIQVTVPTLAGGASFVITFGVRIDP